MGDFFAGVLDPRKCPDQRGLRRDTPNWRAMSLTGIRGNAPIRGDYDFQVLFADTGDIQSEEMPRSEGITTSLQQSSQLSSQHPRKCPDQRGLRRPALPSSQSPNFYPRKCPDQRGLRHRGNGTYLRVRDDPRKCPDQRGLRLKAWTDVAGGDLDPRKCPDQRGLRPG